jgi:uncharacterized protein
MHWKRAVQTLSALIAPPECYSSATDMILYLHGFRSSPQSRKAQQIKVALAARGRVDDYLCPPLPASPREAIDRVLTAIDREDPARLSLIGSSLGGYYATWLAERIGCRAVLLNPAIKPFEDLKAHLGRQPVFFSSDEIDMKPAYLDELHALDTPFITQPDRYFLVAATGDEVIDYRAMVAKYAGCRQRVIAGSDHQIHDFAQYLDEVLRFCGIE